MLQDTKPPVHPEPRRDRAKHWLRGRERSKKIRCAAAILFFVVAASAAISVAGQ